MKEQEQAPEKERRDWVIILIILLFGFLCVILAGGWAIRFAPTWRLDTDMGSNIDPNSDFLTNRPSEFLEPLDPSILTQPAWINIFLTPGASFETSIPVTSLPTSTPLATNTAILPTNTLVGPSPTSTLVGPSPTNTFIYIPPPPTNTPKPPPPLIPVDFSITKTDGVTTYTPGLTLTYTVVVTNNSSVNVSGVTVSDTKPSQVTTWGWCVAPCTPTANTNANLSTTVNLAAGNSITYSILANIDLGATGNLVNTASVGVPSGYIDTNNGNSSATDTDTLTTISADLSITKDDGVTIVNNGNTVTYTVRVTNSGPDTVTGAILSDPAVAGLNKTGVLCSGTPSQCVTPPSVAQIQNGTFALPTLTNGQFYEISISASVTATSGNVTNTATVSAPAGVNDPNTANNSASDTDAVTLTADLQITKTDNSTDYVANALKTYVITVTNFGPSDVTGASVTDLTLTNATNSNLAGSTWSCSGTGGASCTPFGFNVNINDTVVNLPSGSSVTYTVLALVVASPSGSLDNTATVTAPAGITDPNLANNSVTDSDTLIVSSGTSYGNIGAGQDGAYENLNDGDSIILSLSSAITVDGTHAGPELIYYERDAGGWVNMDWIILEVSDGSNWYSILNWGDGLGNTGTNIDVVTSPPNSTDCATEADNCHIDGALLADFGGNGVYSGIIIDLDALSPGIIPSGTTVSYVRITVPPGSGTAGIDGIYVVP